MQKMKYLEWASHMPECGSRHGNDEICDCGLFDLRCDEEDNRVQKNLDAAFQDTLIHGQGFIKAKRHIPHDEIFKSASDLWLDKIAKELHYPDCWDTMAYPTIYDALYEMASCSECSEGQRVLKRESVTDCNQLNGWQPIETAPKDGSILAVTRNGIVKQVCWNNGIWAGAGYDIKLTHWMPLPKPPEDDRRRG